MRTVYELLKPLHPICSKEELEHAIRIAMLEGYKLACSDCSAAAFESTSIQDCRERILSLRDAKTPESFL